MGVGGAGVLMCSVRLFAIGPLLDVMLLGGVVRTMSHILHVCYFHTAASNPRLHFESIYQATCQHFSDSQSSGSSALKKSCLPVGKNLGS